MDPNKRLRAKQERLARTVLQIAGEVEADEQRVKEAILSAAEAGDSDTVARIMRRWMRRPVREVVEKLSNLLG